MADLLARSVRRSFARSLLIPAAAVALALGTGCAYFDSTSDAFRSRDNQASSKATTQSTSQITSRASSTEFGALVYGIASDAVHAEAAASYLRANEPQLQQDLALGAGPTLDDLASIAEIRPEHAREFGRLLQRNRQELLAAADARQLTPARAAACLARVGELIAGHPVLAQDRLAWLARHAPPAG